MGTTKEDTIKKIEEAVQYYLDCHNVDNKPEIIEALFGLIEEIKGDE